MKKDYLNIYLMHIYITYKRSKDLMAKNLAEKLNTDRYNKNGNSLSNIMSISRS